MRALILPVRGSGYLRAGLALLLMGVTASFVAFECRYLLWESLAAWTFALVRFFLTLVYTDVVCEPATHLLGTPEFQVRILAPCAGYEGIGLIIVFLSAFQIAFRQSLRFPHTFVMIPIGVATIWFANALRIALLIAIGSSYSPELALEGFHSQAGWIAFLLVAIALVVAMERITWFHRIELLPRPRAVVGKAEAYLLPFLSLVAITMLATALADPVWLAPLRLFVPLAVLLWFLPKYRMLSWNLSGTAAFAGVAVAGLWWLLLPSSQGSGGSVLQLWERVPSEWADAWIFCRLAGYVLIAPLAEELAFRGFLLRRWMSPDFERAPSERISWMALGFSSLAFGLLHGPCWIPGTLAGLVFGLVWQRRGSLGDAVLAHLVANGALVILAFLLGDWSLVS